MEALTVFFNTYVLGPDRNNLVAASLPAAAEHATLQHQREEEILSRRLAEVNDSMDNLIRTIERGRTPGSQCGPRAEARIAELDQEATRLATEIQRHQAAAPAAPANNVALLDRLQVAEIDLSRLSADRLQRFLEAFQIKIYYNGQTRRVRLKAEIAAGLVDRLAQTVGWARRANSSGLKPISKEEAGPVDDGASQTINGSSYGLCPRRDTTYNCAPAGRLAIAADLAIG